MKKESTATYSLPLDFEQLLRLPQAALKKALAEELREAGYAPVSRKGFLYAPGEVPVLLTAHMDTVHRSPVEVICYSSDGKIAMSPQGIGGDDRAGIWMVLQIIREAKCHVLFCEDEEIGCIGAQRFCSAGIVPEVNYLVELDRKGANDAVFYRCGNAAFAKYICGFGFQKDFGTCSDISYLAPHLGLAAVNISCGYYQCHQLGEYIDLAQMGLNARRVCEMVKQPSARFEYIEQEYWGCFSHWQTQMEEA